MGQPSWPPSGRLCKGFDWWRRTMIVILAALALIASASSQAQANSRLLLQAAARAAGPNEAGPGQEQQQQQQQQQVASTHQMHPSLHHPQPIPPHYVMLGNTNSTTRTFRPSILGSSSALSSGSANQSSAAAAQATTTSDLSNARHSADSPPADSAGRGRGLFEKICIGTSNRMSGQSNKTDHYQTLVERYKNCTYVIGNLEITWLEAAPGQRALDLSFLESIREITGYLLIAYVNVERISMPNLQIIRGRELLKLNNGNEFALFVINNELSSLEMPNLREIITGDVGFFYNSNLCYMKTIEWEEILNGNHTSRFMHDATKPIGQLECACDKSCRGSCWGPGADMCQKFSKIHCSPQCDKGRCFGTGPRDCCHLFCAGGCTGPKQTDCLACKSFNNDGECIQECPSMRKYNPSKFSWEPDPNGKYAFGATCVKQCPANLLRDNGACVRSCPQDKRDDQGECIACTGACPKNCQGVDVVNSRNIEQFVGCTEIQGSITILDTSFTGYTDVNSNNTMGARYEPMHPSRLRVFETIRVITGFLNVQAAHVDFKNLTFFSKLEAIEGRQTTDMFHSLSIIKTSLVALNLRSLRRVRGGILIKENRDLCFAQASHFVKSNIARADEVTVDNNGPEAQCKARNQRCHDQCSPNQACWGPGQDECIGCRNFKLDDYCVQSCPSTWREVGLLSFEAANRTCAKCHPECRDACSAPDATSCRACRNFKDGPYCVAECPKHKFNDQGLCQECHKSCSQSDGCTGRSERLGAGGCNSCDKLLVEQVSPQLLAKCMRADEPCPLGYFQEYGTLVPDKHPLKPLERKPICRRCHTRCKSCNGYGTHKDVCECAGYVANDQCEDTCSRDYYADERTRRCIKCSRECNGCFGPTHADCFNCRVYRIYSNGGPVAAARIASSPGAASLGSAAKQQANNFNCTSQCPADKPHRISESNLLDPYCSEHPSSDSDAAANLISSAWFLLMLVISASLTLCVMVYKCKMDKDKLSTVKLTMRLSGFDDVEPLKQSNVKPNLAPLRSIKETELWKGHCIGSGVGGTVYQGAWHPDGTQDPKKIMYVAIKVLRDNGQPNMHKEFLDEAYTMASVNHPNLVKLLAVCMTPKQLILVTPLMLLGCLLEHVQKKRHQINSKDLLEWGKQVANGMAYLEERRLVHRDLALRNVLLQNKHRALISDFGLAKFLDVDQNEYKVDPSGGTRLPIKWLAPECIRERKFTHKSDVWAFGVTIWELLSFGERPFNEIENIEVCEAIEKGARLKQPKHVSTEVYKVMFACWFYNPDERPNFKSLAETFRNFARDPERYLSLELVVDEQHGADEQEQQEQDEDEAEDEEQEQVDEAVNEQELGEHFCSPPGELVGETLALVGAGAPDSAPAELDCANNNEYDSAASLADEQAACEQLAASQHQLDYPLPSEFDFGAFATRHHQQQHHHSESDSAPSFMLASCPHQQRARLDDAFTRSQRQMSCKSSSGAQLAAGEHGAGTLPAATDLLAPHSARYNADSCWTVNHTVSTNSLGQRSEQPTDSDDYLIPSPGSNEDKFSKWPLLSERKHAPAHKLANSSRLPPIPPSSRDPPHSAGLIGISNQEYFLTRLNYASATSATNASSGHIPQSLV